MVRAGARVGILPDWETLPYDQFSPHQDLVSERLATLYRISRGECDVVRRAGARPRCTASRRRRTSRRTRSSCRRARRLDVDALRAQLALAGYSHVTQVVSPGEFSVRGGLIDLFPMGARCPTASTSSATRSRAIKTFDVDTQRTLYPVRDMRLLPAREFPLDDAGRTRFRSRFREVFEGDPSKPPLYKDVSQRHRAGRHRVLPAAVLRRDRDARRLPARRRDVALHGDVDAAIERFWQDTESRYRLLRGDKARPLLPPAAAVRAGRRVLRRRSSRSRASRCRLRTREAAMRRDAPIRRCRRSQVDRRADDPLAALKDVVAIARRRAC